MNHCALADDFSCVAAKSVCVFDLTECLKLCNRYHVIREFEACICLAYLLFCVCLFMFYFLSFLYLFGVCFTVLIRLA